MKTILTSALSVLFIAAIFIILNNITQIPWEIMAYLWYAFLPCCTWAIAFTYGLTARRSGGGILLAAAILVPALILSTNHALPFASTLTAIPSVIIAALLPLPAEITARRIRRKRKKQGQKDPAQSL